MSDPATRIPLDQARDHAEGLARSLAPGCERVAIAGSVRREKPTVGDLEIVAIPRMSTDLLGQELGSLLDPVLARLVASGVLEPIKGGPRFKQFFAPALGARLDLFVCRPETWGPNLLIRTGSAGFSNQVVTRRGRTTQGGRPGLLPADCRVEGLRIHRDGRALDTPEETDVFDVLGLPWLHPRERG